MEKERVMFCLDERTSLCRIVEEAVEDMMNWKYAPAHFQLAYPLPHTAS